MRSARVGDFKRKLAVERPAWTTRLETVSYEDVPGLGSGLVTIESPLTFLAGPNGVGKSTLAKCIYATLSENAHVSLEDARTIAGTITVEGAVGGEKLSRTLDLANLGVDRGALGIEVAYLDSARVSLRLQEEIRKFEKVDELINGIAVIELGDLDLAAVSRIICRDYRFVHLYEVELGAIQPFFEVGYGPGSYNSATMGDGELAALVIWWHFWRAQPNSIIILEEPETFLSALCQRNLCEYIISAVVQKRLTCVVSSHSSAFIENVSEDGLRFLTRSDDGVSILSSDPPPVLLKSIGVKFARKVQLFVEDTAAKAFCRGLLERFNPSLSRVAGLSVSGGDGEVKADLKKFADLDLELTGIGVFDGDIPNDQIPKGSLKLPGDVPVEILLKQAASADITRLIDLSGKDDAGVILHSLEGCDHHDWLEEVAKEFGIDKGQAFALLFRLWIENAANSVQGSAFTSELAKIVSSARAS